MALDGKEAPGWMNDWTIFYWGWWIAWSPFVGMFIAKISKGTYIKIISTINIYIKRSLPESNTINLHYFLYFPRDVYFNEFYR